MSTTADPRCPECGGKIGQTATYCMHCSAELSERGEDGETDADGGVDVTGPTESAEDDEQLLDPNL